MGANINTMSDQNDIMEKVSLTTEEKETISAKARITAENNIESGIDLSYLSEDMKSGREVVIQLVIDHCIRNNISNPTFIKSNTGTTLNGTLKNNRIKVLGKTSAISIINKSLKDFIK